MEQCHPSGSSPTSSRPATSRRRSTQLAAGIERGERFQTLLGVTGSGKTATIAWMIERVQRPTLVIAPNKTLAAQLANEFREFFPDNAVEYFVSYYDYYQPEAYIPPTDTYIEKDSSINDEIERLRHSATAALLTRRDVIVVASVSCIYGLGIARGVRGTAPRAAGRATIHDRERLLRRLVDMQYDRNDLDLVPRHVPRARRHGRGAPRLRGAPRSASSSSATRSSGITTLHPLTGEVLARGRRAVIFPGHPLRRRRRAHAHARSTAIEAELAGAARRARAPGQAARGAAAADAHAATTSR